MKYKPTKEEIKMVEKIRENLIRFEEFKKNNPQYCNCWMCQVGTIETQR